ncbi:nucleotide exchange factor GrpE [Fulvivirgaceae bacterium PWU4]|uniref:Protein GrpE n=1 Tax=Chryseosolibacter histidini TaxID=2782349 RepID=A0AAP2DM96_9BACT|nr:nucleotide exchange factor GrpE [Chryseosolibacter histidini]MBT1698900.1 nucleotide exchange factor GrpE [Chryseosolibacter histidini]
MDNTQIKEELENKEMVSENTAASAAAGQPAEQPQPDEAGKLKEEVASAKDKYIRLYSEFENFRRRTAKEKLEMVQSANEQLIKALLPVADDFERAEKSFREKNDKDAEGFFLIQNKFRKVLELYGVKPMDVQSGSSFNTDMHEAITQIPAPDESLKGKIVDVVEKGYLLNDKVVRFAKVVVGS